MYVATLCQAFCGTAILFFPVPSQRLEGMTRFSSRRYVLGTPALEITHSSRLASVAQGEKRGRVQSLEVSE